MLTSDIIGSYQSTYKGRKHILVKTIARKTLELKNHKIDRVIETADGAVEILISQKKRRTLPSSCCKKKSRVVDVLPSRTWRHVSLWGRKVLIVYSPCLDSGFQACCIVLRKFLNFCQTDDILKVTASPFS